MVLTMGKTDEAFEDLSKSSSPDLLLNGSKAPINSRAPYSIAPSLSKTPDDESPNLFHQSSKTPEDIFADTLETESNENPRKCMIPKVDVYVPLLNKDLIEDKLDLLASEYDGTSIISDDFEKYEEDDSFDIIKNSEESTKNSSCSHSSLGTLNLDLLEKEDETHHKEEMTSLNSSLENPRNNYETMLEMLNNEAEQMSVYTPSSTMNTHEKSSNKSKLENLMNYLDIVEMDNDISEKSSKPESSENNVMELEIYEILKRPPKKLAEEIIILKLKIEDHIRTEKSLGEELQSYKDSIASSSSQFQKELKHRLKMQKTEYDSAISRHQNFIDQLIEDKKGLRDQVDGLLNEHHALEKKHEDGIKTLESRHSAEIRRLKSLYESSSKLKQEKWLDEKTKRIKEQTVKGLEPELQRLIARHTAEMKKMETDKTQSLLIQEREMHQRHLSHVQELRTIWDNEQVELIQKERELLQNRHTQYLEELRFVHKEELDRLQEQLTRERDRSLDERGHFEREAEQIRRIAQQRAKDEIERIREEEENKRRTLLKKHSNELSLLRENEVEDRMEWERNCRGRLDEEWKLREDNIRRTITMQKEEELKEALQKHEDKVNQYKDLARNEIDERVARLKERYEAEIKDLKDELESIRDNQARTRDELRKKEEENLVLMAVSKQKELYAEEILKINSKLEAEREEVRKAVRGEFSSTIETLVEEKNSLLGEMSSLRIKVSELNTQIESNKVQMRIEKEEDAERIHSRVKSAISRKDEAIAELKKTLDKTQAENDNLEALLRRQAEIKYLKKK